MIDAFIAVDGVHGGGSHGLSKLPGDVIGDSTIHLGILCGAFTLVVLLIQEITVGL